MDKADAIALAAEGAAKIQAAGRWFQQNELTGEFAGLQQRAADLAWRFEMMTNSPPGTFTNPDGSNADT
jgi:hypothetical protein